MPPGSAGPADPSGGYTPPPPFEPPPPHEPPPPSPPGGGGGDGGGDSTAPLTTRKAPRIGKSFSSRNPTPIGAIGLVLIVALLWAAFNAANLPLIGGGTTYHAMFTQSANLKSGDDVRIAGVKVGTVDAVSLATDDKDCLPAGAKPGTPPPTCVKVDFTVKSAFVGNQSQANIKIKTLLGAKLLDIDSIGTSSMKGGSTIPLDRTTSPYDVYPAFTALTRTVDKIDTNQLVQAFNTISSDFSGTPSAVRPLVSGLSRLSTEVASRDADLQILLQKAKSVTGVLADRDQDLKAVLQDGGLLLDELNQRRDAIHSLLINTQALTAQLNGLVADNQKTLGPLLVQLNKILDLLNSDQQNLDRGLSLLGPFYRVFDNVLGNGRWFDNYIQNLSVGGILGVLGIGSN